MPKNQKSKKNSAKRMEQVKRELFLKEQLPGTVYGQVTRALGECKFTVNCFDDIERMCQLRKSVKRSNVSVDCIVLIGTRDFDQSKGDIVYVYTYEEAQKLKNMQEIPNVSVTNSNFVHDDDVDEKENAVDIEFDFENI